MTDGLKGTPSADNADQIAAAITGGQVQRAVEAAPPEARDRIAEVATSAFVDSLNHIIWIAMVLALVTGVLTLLLIRQQDFVAHGGPPAGDADAAGPSGPGDPRGSAAETPVPSGSGAGGSHRHAEAPGKHLLPTDSSD